MNNWVPYKQKILTMEGFELVSLHQGYDGLQIIFDNTYEYVKYGFDSFLFYSSSDESDRWRTISTVLANYGKDFFKSSIAFEIENSSLIEWFNKESFNKYDGWDIHHFSFVGMNDIVDVLSLTEPEIEVGAVR